MHERVADGLEDGLVELGLVARNDQLDLLVLAARQIPDHPRETLEDAADGHHADLENVITQFVDETLDFFDRASQFRGMEGCGGSGQARLIHHEFADQAD